MRVGSLFSGVGGFDLAAEQAGMTVCWQVEADAKARKVLAARWPLVSSFDDVRTVGAHNLTPVDVLMAGFPCQDLSVAGKRAGLAGERSGLFYEAMRVARELSIPWVVLENVPGLLSSQRGADFQAVLDEMVESGYGVAWRILDSRHFGVPQRRRRVFLVGCLGGDERRAAAVLFESTGGVGDSAPGGEAGAGAARGAALQSLSPGEEQRRRIYDAAGVSPSLGAGGTGGQNVPSVAYALRRDPGGIGQRHNCTYVPFTQNQRDEVREIGDNAGCLSSSEGMKQRTYLAFDNRNGKHDAAVGTQRADCHGANPMVAATLKQRGRGYTDEVMDNLQVVASALSASMGHHGHSSPRGDGSDNLVAATLNSGGNSGGFRTEPGEHLVPDVAPCLETTAGDYSRADGFMALPSAYGVRRLTPLECERLQGFPDGWTCLCDAKGVTAQCKCPDSPRYKQMGNAVTVNVVRWLALRLKAAAEGVTHA